VNQVTNGKANGGPAAGPTLAGLAEKLSELREHLDQVVARLNTLHDRDQVVPAAAPSATPGRRRRFAKASTETDRFRCHECDKLSPSDQTGWTLRLCGDDELHPFCPSCDRRHVNGNGAGTHPSSAATTGPERAAASRRETS
jgi:hypothetical protein